MIRTTPLLIALFLLGCTGPTGPQGPQGPAGPSGSAQRLADYCNATFASATSANGWTLSASCNSATDIPVEGWCYEPAGVPPGAFRSDDGPVNWNDTTKVAGWSCTWGWQVGATPAPIVAKVEICCATP